MTYKAHFEESPTLNEAFRDCTAAWTAALVRLVGFPRPSCRLHVQFDDHVGKVDVNEIGGLARLVALAAVGGGAE